MRIKALAVALYLVAFVALGSIAQNGPAPQGGFPQNGGGGTVTSVASGNLSPLFTSSVSGSTGAASITYSLSTAGAYTFFGNGTGSTAAPTFMSATTATAALNQFTSSLQGLVPGSGGGTSNFLRADGTWAVPAGGVSGSGTTGQIAYWGGSSSLTGDTGGTYTSGTLQLGNNAGTQGSILVFGSGSGATGLATIFLLGNSPANVGAGEATLNGGDGTGSAHANIANWALNGNNVTNINAGSVVGNAGDGTGSGGELPYMAIYGNSTSNYQLGDITITGGASGLSPNITFTGGTSGSTKLVCPLVAGSGTVITLPSVAYTGATSQATATANIPSRDTSGNESFLAGHLLTASTETVGVANTTLGTSTVAGSGATGLGSITMTGGSATSTITMQGTTNATGLGTLALASGSSAGNNPTVTFYGKTSGNTILTPAAAAGGTFTLPSVSYTGPTVQAVTGAVGILANTGAETYATAFTLTSAGAACTVGTIATTAGSVTVASTGATSTGNVILTGVSTGGTCVVKGTAAGLGNATLTGSTTTSGSLSLAGSTSGINIFTVPAVAGGVTFTGPTVALTEVTAQPGANGAMVTQSTAGARGTQNVNGSPIDKNAPTAISTSQTIAVNTTYSATGTFTATLPTAVGAQGQPITIFMPGTSTMTVNTTSSQTFGGSASGAKAFTSAASTPITLLLESDNVNWHYTQGL